MLSGTYSLYHLYSNKVNGGFGRTGSEHDGMDIVKLTRKHT